MAQNKVLAMGSRGGEIEVGLHVPYFALNWPKACVDDARSLPSAKDEVMGVRHYRIEHASEYRPGY